jgi:lipopolysaccharide export system protein LptC
MRLLLILLLIVVALPSWLAANAQQAPQEDQPGASWLPESAAADL